MIVERRVRFSNLPWIKACKRLESLGAWLSVVRLLSIFFVSGCCVEAAPMRDPLDRPNVVVILADAMGWGDLAINGNPIVKTPHLDNLAKAGARLERFYVSPASAPSRATILTGRHCLHTGVTADAWGANVLHEHEITFVEILRDVGYQTGFFGIWKNGVNRPHDPGSQGFQKVGEIEDAASFLREAAQGPFCAFLASPSLTQGDQIPAPLIEEYLEAGLSEELARTYAGITTFDETVGRILAELETLGISEKTIVLVLSDCGPEAVPGRYNARLYGTKGSLHEGGLRVPCLWQWSGVIPQGQIVNEISHHTDIFVTILGMVGASPPTDRQIDGMNLAPLLMFGADRRWPNRNLGSVWIPGRNLDQARKAFRTTRWVIVKDPPWRRESRDEEWEIYDLLADPHQNYNVEDAYTFVLAGLKSDQVHWFHKSQVFGYPILPTVLDEESVRLPAEAALFPEGWDYPGEIDCLDQWDHPDFSARWPLLISAKRRAAVSLRYRLAGKATTVELSFGREAFRETLRPTLEWQSTGIGEMNLEPGEAWLRLETEGPASQLEIQEIVISGEGTASSRKDSSRD